MVNTRRAFLATSAASVAAASQPFAAAASSLAPADYTLHIAKARLELAPQCVVETTAYNGQFPGPLLRFRTGRQVVVDVINDTDTPEQLHWHGQFVSSSVDGAAEERSPYIPAHGSRRLAFVPGPAGLRFYHTHLRAGSDLTKGTYTGQAGAVYIEPSNDPGAYDREVFLVLKEFEPSLSHGGDMSMDFLAPATRVAALQTTGESEMRASLQSSKPKGFEVGYRCFSINGRVLGHGDPIRVRAGERVLFHVLNASATEIRSLALPGHTFKVVALDGNPVPVPARVPVLWLGTAERIDAIVQMNRPGVWVLGDTSDDDRHNGMGIVVEYAGGRGTARWEKPAPSRWDYTQFGASDSAAHPDETIDWTIAKRNAADGGFNVWTINGIPYGNGKPPSMDRMKPLLSLREGARYRIRMRNASDDIHPVHLHRHTFELTRVAGRPTSGVRKDVVMLGGYQQMEIDFVADNPGLTLFHCHQQLHMDFGFMALFEYAPGKVVRA